MKTQDKQILEKLQAYDSEMVLKAFELYKESLEVGLLKIEEALEKDGWEHVDEKPVDKPFYFLNDKYWILSESARHKKIKNVKQEAMVKKKQSSVVPAKKTSMSLKKIPFLCPICKAGLYKQKVCPACKDGKKGYVLRFICEENPDHEFLL